MARDPVPRWLGSLTVLVAALSLAGALSAQERAGLAPHHIGYHTGTLLFPPPGVMVAALGAEYLPAVSNDLAGVQGEILRAPTLGLQLGLSEHAMFEVTWPVYNRLRVHAQQDPPPLGRRLGSVSSDWGDVTIATLIRLHPDRGRWPAAGIRFAAKLPNSNEKLGIGENTTDVFATALLSRTFADRLSVFTDLGLGILTEPAALFAQKDVLTYGAMADWRLRDRLRLVGEVAGQAVPRVAVGTGNRSELRAGLEWCRPSIHWSALAVRGLSGGDADGVGVSISASAGFAVLGQASR